MCRRSVADDLTDVRGATTWVDQLAADAGLSDDVRYNIEVCLEEALANLIQHGCVLDGRKDIIVAFAAAGRQATITVVDRCVPFDAAREPPPSRPTREDLRVGGQGLRLMRAFSNGMTYRSDGGRNELTMWFDAPASPPPGVHS